MNGNEKFWLLIWSIVFLGFSLFFIIGTISGAYDDNKDIEMAKLGYEKTAKMMCTKHETKYEYIKSIK